MIQLDGNGKSKKYNGKQNDEEITLKEKKLEKS